MPGKNMRHRTNAAVILSLKNFAFFFSNLFFSVDRSWMPPRIDLA